MTTPLPGSSSEIVRRQRYRLMVQIERLLDPPATYLAFVFAAALVIELVLTAQRQPVPAVLGWLQVAIWGFFVVHFLLGFTIAPDRLRYLRRSWLTVLSLAIPFLRVIRVLRLVALLRAARLVRVFGAMNRTANSLHNAFAWNGAGMAIGLSTSVLFLSAAGIYLFESESSGSRIDTFAEALWWSAATLTTVGAVQEPVTVGGRVIALFVMVAGLVLLGYVAGVLATVLFERRQSKARQVRGPRNG